MIPPEPFRIEAGLAVYRFGEGSPAFFMPGPHRLQKVGDPTADALIAALVEQGRQVITYDPPGAGRSPRPARLSMAEMHNCAEEALNVCGMAGPVDALGHSMGGLAVLAYALEYPHRIRRLVLVGTGSGGPAYRRAKGALWNSSHPGFAKMAALGVLCSIWPAQGPQILFMNYVKQQSYLERSRLIAGPVNWRDWLRPRAGRPDWERVARRLDYGPRLAEIAVPTLVLVGRYDPQYPLGASEELAARIPGAHLVIFERSGHYPFLEEPEAFRRALAGFLHHRTNLMEEHPMEQHQ